MIEPRFVGRSPIKVPNVAAKPAVQPAQPAKMHSAVQANNRQFGGASQAIKGAVGKLRVAKRLGGLLRRGR